MDRNAQQIKNTGREIERTHAQTEQKDKGKTDRRTNRINNGKNIISQKKLET